MRATRSVPQHVALAVTGASGAIYAERILHKLIHAGAEVSLVFSRCAHDVVHWELEDGGLLRQALASPPGEFAPRLSEGRPGAGRVRRHDNDNLMAPLASGSRGAEALLVAPCSMGTLGRIAHGISSCLIERTADVMLKERRPLVLVARECPLSLIHLRNMTLLTEAGGVVVPASPGFYHKPQSLVELVDFVAERALAQVGLAQNATIAWEGEP